MRSVNAHYVNAFQDLQHSGELLDVTLASKEDDILQAHKISAQTELMKCEFCEYSAHNFNDFEKHMYEKHRTGGSNDHKEIMVDTRSTSVQTEDADLLKCKECEHSENFKDSWRNFHIETDMDNEKVVDKRLGRKNRVSRIK